MEENLCAKLKKVIDLSPEKLLVVTWIDTTLRDAVKWRSMGVISKIESHELI